MVTIADGSGATRVSSAAMSSVEYRCISLHRATRSASAAGVGTSVGLGIYGLHDSATLGEAARMVPVRMSTAKSNEYSKSRRDVHHTAPCEFPRFCLTGAGYWKECGPMGNRAERSPRWEMLQ